MSKSLKRVRATLEAAGVTADIRETDLARTAADAALIRAQTGFAIGGVSPVGHLAPCRMWFDRRLLDVVRQ